MKAHSGSLAALEEKIPQIIERITSGKILRAIIAAGIILRVSQFLYNRSLTEGEAALALNIIERSYLELLKPLDYVQGAPIGFLILQKSAANILGTNEYALRLFPLIAGIIALFLFYKVAQKAISKEAIPIALILFAVGNHLIYFASEVKQYSSDVAITLLIILMAIYVFEKDFSIKYMILFGLVGAISLWFSHPALFTFCGAVLVLLLYIIRKKEWNNLVGLLIVGTITIISFGLNYAVSLRSLSRHTDLLNFWQPSFMPFPPTSLSDIKWFGYVFLRTFSFPLGLSIYELLLAVLSFLFGCIVMFYRRKNILMILLLPIILTMIASGLQKYPFEGRLLLFITPLMVLIIAEGMDYIRERTGKGSNILGLALVCILLTHPVALAGYHLVKPRAPEELRQTLDYLDERHRQGDVMYVYYASLNAFKYYSDRYAYTDDYVVGAASRDDWTNYYKDLKKLKGNKRVWVLFSHIATGYGVDEERLFLSYLNILGTQLDAFKTSGASAYLYDLSNRAPQFE